MSTETERDILFSYLLELADDSLILGHRLSEWAGTGPTLEEDIALSNIALDYLGQAGFLYEQAAKLDSAQRSADDLVFFRDAPAFRNCLLVELENADFAKTILRLFLFSSYLLLRLEQLKLASDKALSDFASKALKEVRYHQRHGKTWVLRLGDGTEESHRRLSRALDELWPHVGELFESSAAEKALSSSAQIPDKEPIFQAWAKQIQSSFLEATLNFPEVQRKPLFQGRSGMHTEALVELLSDMQSTARAIPGAKW